MTGPGSEAYSLRDVVPDGSISGPRWELHVIKLATHAAVFTPLVCLSVLFLRTPHFYLSGILAGPVLYLLIILWHVAERAHFNLVDKIHDTCFALPTMAGGALATGRLVEGASLLVAAIALWVALHRQAIP